MIYVFGLLFWVWSVGCITALLSDWPIEDTIFWPIEIIRRYWTKHR